MNLRSFRRRTDAFPILAVASLLAVLCGPVGLAAQSKDDGWTFTARFTTVFTGGNSGSNDKR